MARDEGHQLLRCALLREERDRGEEGEERREGMEGHRQIEEGRGRQEVGKEGER